MNRSHARLIRLRKWALDEVRREMADLLKLVDRIDAQVAAIHDRLVEEQVLAGRSAMLSEYGHFANLMLDHRDALGEKRREIEALIEAKKAELAEAYKDLKTVEIAAAQAALEEKREQARLEQQDLDEIAGRQHSRALGRRG